MQGFYAKQKMRRMKSYVYRLETVQPAEKICVKNKINPKVFEKIGGILMCRSSLKVHSIPSFIQNLSALILTIPSNTNSTPHLPIRF